MASAAFNWLFRRAPRAPAKASDYAWNINTNPYQCKRTWPPEFSKLSNTHQFSLERRYRRRTKLKFARPVWTRFTKLIQWGTITGFVIYGVLFMEVDERLISPFQPIRDWYNEQIGALSASRRPQASLDNHRPNKSSN